MNKYKKRFNVMLKLFIEYQYGYPILTEKLNDRCEAIKREILDEVNRICKGEKK